MKNKIIGLMAVVMAVVMIAPAMAISWDIDFSSKDFTGNSNGKLKTGTAQWGMDNTVVDPYYAHEVTKLSTKATWTGKGFVREIVDYKCPKVAGDAKYGKAKIINMVNTYNKNGISGTFNTNYRSNYKIANNGGGTYPNGNFAWASYGTHLEAAGDYGIGSAIYETTKKNANNHFDYYMTGKGTGKIRYGASRFNSGANWGDKRGTVSLNRWEYNEAEATGSGTFIEDLGGDDYLENARYTLPGGGSVHVEVNFKDGMNKIPIWMIGK